MKYIGNKRDIAKYIIPFLNKFNDREIYIEPFVGGANIIDKVNYKIRRGYDINPYLIDLLKHVSNNGNLPSTILEQDYIKVKEDFTNFPKWYIGLIGFCSSKNGGFFEGYSKKKDNIDYANESIRELEIQRKNIEDIVFHTCDYKTINTKDIKATIYCDPPHKMSKIINFNKFNYDEFYTWCREQSIYNPVFLSDYDAPVDFICIWENNKKTNKKIEKLFIHNNWFNELNNVSL